MSLSILLFLNVVCSSLLATSELFARFFLNSNELIALNNTRHFKLTRRTNFLQLNSCINYIQANVVTSSRCSRYDEPKILFTRSLDYVLPLLFYSVVQVLKVLKLHFDKPLPWKEIAKGNQSETLPPFKACWCIDCFCLVKYKA